MPAPSTDDERHDEESSDQLAAELAALLDRERERTARKTEQAVRRASRAAARAAARAVPPEPAAAFAALSLGDLRNYRQAVAQEEERLGYWQRVLATRLEALRGNGADLDMTRLRPALARERLQQARLQIGAATRQPLPELPDLAILWSPLDTAELETAMVDAAAALVTYRDALANRVRSATNELIARYRYSPDECLAVLPA